MEVYYLVADGFHDALQTYKRRTGGRLATLHGVNQSLWHCWKRNPAAPEVYAQSGQGHWGVLLQASG